MSKHEIDEHAATELVLYIDNDPKLHKQWEAIVVNLWKHMDAGRFNRSRAADGFMHVVDAGARAYTKEFGHPQDVIFNKPTRRDVAETYAESFERNGRDERRLRVEKKPAAKRCKQLVKGRLV